MAERSERRCAKGLRDASRSKCSSRKARRLPQNLKVGGVVGIFIIKCLASLHHGPTSRPDRYRGSIYNPVEEPPVQASLWPCYLTRVVAGVIQIDQRIDSFDGLRCKSWFGKSSVDASIWVQMRVPAVSLDRSQNDKATHRTRELLGNTLNSDVHWRKGLRVCDPTANSAGMLQEGGADSFEAEQASLFERPGKQ